MTKVSVIVAVYNMEKHLRQCVESVLAQTLKDVEVVCVDDIRHLYLYGRRYYSAAQRREAWQLIRDDYDSVDLSLVPDEQLRKFGYMPLRSSWTLFRLQEWAYFTLKWLTRRI